MNMTPGFNANRSVKTNQKIAILLITASLLFLASWACAWFPLDWSQWDFGKAPEENNPGLSSAQEQWDINRCSAIDEVKIDLDDFSEESFKNSDGTIGGTDCAYTYEVTNTSDGSLILIYYDHFSYGDNPPPNNYEFGWQKTAPLPSGESWSLMSSASSTPKQPLYLDLIYSLAVVYDNSNCAWITADGIRQEVLEIAVEDPLQSPCQIIDSQSGPKNHPDLDRGLLEN